MTAENYNPNVTTPDPNATQTAADPNAQPVNVSPASADPNAPQQPAGNPDVADFIDGLANVIRNVAHDSDSGEPVALRGQVAAILSRAANDVRDPAPVKVDPTIPLDGESAADYIKRTRG